MKKIKTVTKCAESIRKTWSFNPATRVVKSKKQYNRADKSWKKDF